MHEEVLDLVALELGNILNILQVCPAGIVNDAQELVVAAGLISHLEHAKHAGGHDHAGQHRLGQNHEGVQRIAVFAEGAVNEPIVERIGHGGKQVAVQVNLAGFVIYLVFIAGTFGDFDGYFNAHAALLCNCVVGFPPSDILPRHALR